VNDNKQIKDNPFVRPTAYGYCPLRVELRRRFYIVSKPKTLIALSVITVTYVN